MKHKLTLISVNKSQLCAQFVVKTSVVGYFVTKYTLKADYPTKRLPMSCARRCIDQSNSQFIGVLGLPGTCFSQKLPSLPWESSAPHNTLFLGPSSLIIANSNSIGSAVFVWVSNVMLYNALSMGKKTPKLPNSLRFRYFAEGGSSRGHRQHPQKFGSKDRGCGSGDVLADRQTHRHTHTHYIRIEQTKSSQTCCSR